MKKSKVRNSRLVRLNWLFKMGDVVTYHESTYAFRLATDYLSRTVNNSHDYEFDRDTPVEFDIYVI